MAGSSIGIGNPRLVIILTGKRKSGKDYVAALLDRLIPRKVLLRISVPIKRQFTAMKGLDFTESLSDSKYKESFRSEMITWSEGVRKSDPNVFLRTAIQESSSKDFSVWLLVDARRPCDLELFKEEYSHAKTITVRIVSSKETREKRGWTFQAGVDDVESECALDHVSDWDLVVRNQQDTSHEQLEQQLQPVIQAALDVLRDG